MPNHSNPTIDTKLPDTRSSDTGSRAGTIETLVALLIACWAVVIALVL